MYFNPIHNNKTIGLISKWNHRKNLKRQIEFHFNLKHIILFLLNSTKNW